VVCIHKEGGSFSFAKDENINVLLEFGAQRDGRADSISFGTIR
jgi:hypothetical protein